MIKTILILTADPRYSLQRRLDVEVREIQDGIMRGKKRDFFHLEQTWATTPDALRRAMLDYEPQVVHFLGYGSAKGIALEHRCGRVHLVTSDALSGLFELFANQVKCVVLSACYSELQAQAISNHIQYVIGMKQGISQAAATSFATGFYDALMAGRSYEEAFCFGQNAIALCNIPENLTPVLKKKRAVADWRIRFSVDSDALGTAKLDQTIKALKQSSKDPTLTLRKIETNGDILLLEGSEVGFSTIKTLFRTGKLNKLLKTTVQEVSMNSKNPTILILEDNEAWLARHERRLQAAGFKCHSTQLAAEAINIATIDSSIKFALIDEVLFVPSISIESGSQQLQRWQGSGVIRELSHLRPDIKFIMVTSAPESRSEGNVKLFRRETSKLKLIPGVVDVIHQQDINENPEALYKRLIKYFQHADCRDSFSDETSVNNNDARPL